MATCGRARSHSTKSAGLDTKKREGTSLLIGVISDTHGYVDPCLGDVFQGVEYILHAGDIGAPEVLDALGALAPVLAVRGNVDRDPGLLKLPEQLNLLMAGVTIQVVHRLDDACPGPETRVLIHGHSHRPIVEWRQNILYLNPGAAGRQGFHTERTAALLDLAGSPTGALIRLGPKALGGTPGRKRRTA